MISSGDTQALCTDGLPPLRTNITGVVVVAVATATAAAVVAVEGEREKERDVDPSRVSRVFSSPTEHTTATRQKPRETRIEATKVSCPRHRDTVIGNSKRNSTKGRPKRTPRVHYDTGVREATSTRRSNSVRQPSSGVRRPGGAGNEPSVTTERPRTPRGSKSQQEVNERASYLCDLVYRPAEGVVSRWRAFIIVRR